MKILLKRSYGPFSLRKEIFEKLSIPYHDIACSTYDEWLVPNKPISKTKTNKLIEWVEYLGSEYVADPVQCKFEVVDIPKGTAYRISEYDGYEYIEYRDEIDWKIAE